MGLRVTDERLQEERQLAEFDGKHGSQLQAYVYLLLITQTDKTNKSN